MNENNMKIKKILDYNIVNEISLQFVNSINSYMNIIDVIKQDDMNVQQVKSI